MEKPKTYTEFEQMQSKRGKRGAYRITAHDYQLTRYLNEDEHTLQTRCVAWFGREYPEWITLMRLWAIPNGEYRTPAAGARLKAEGVLAGVADLQLAVPRKGHGALFIEMKTHKGRQSPQQREFARCITYEDDYRYVVCRSLEEFQAAVIDYLGYTNSNTMAVDPQPQE